MYSTSRAMQTLLSTIGALVLVVAPCLAQTRPTLAEAESRIGVLESQVNVLESENAALQAELTAAEAAVCTKVDLDGDSYRPYFCGGECGCLDPSTAQGCTETAGGEFELVILEDQPVTGDCEQGTAIQDDGPCPIGGGACAGYGPYTYSCGGTSCPSGYVCDGALCHPLCSDAADCVFSVPTFGECIAPVVPCSTDADCPSAWTCDLAESTCTRACYYEYTCDTIVPQPSSYTLTNVGTVQAPAPAACQGLNADLVISSSDALACIAQVEAVVGAPCAYLCGDGGLDPGEQCDDGNTTPGDGCDASCQLEP